MVSHCYVQSAAQDAVRRARMHIGASAGMEFIANRHGQAGIAHPHYLTPHRVHRRVADEFAGTQPGAVDHERF